MAYTATSTIIQTHSLQYLHKEAVVQYIHSSCPPHLEEVGQVDAGRRVEGSYVQHPGIVSPVHTTEEGRRRGRGRGEGEGKGVEWKRMEGEVRGVEEDGRGGEGKGMHISTGTR